MKNNFDPTKNVANINKHGLPLSFGNRLFKDNSHVIIPSIREKDGEERFKAVGLVGDKLYTAVFVWRGEIPRLISVRRSNESEERTYHNFC